MNPVSLVMEYRADLGRRVGQVTLLQGIITPGPTSDWVFLNMNRPFVLTFSGDFVGPVNIRASNLPMGTKPTGAVGRYGILGFANQADVKAFDEPIMWLLVESQITSGVLDSVDLAAG